MKRMIVVLASMIMAFTIVESAQNAGSSSGRSSATRTKAPRKPIFRASKDQIQQAQKILKDKGFYNGEQSGKLDDDTRAGLRKYQTAENIKVTGTLNKLTLERMGVTLTDKQRAM